MVVQYAHCVADILKNYNMSVELYFDIWKSMNKRFQQRFVLMSPSIFFFFCCLYMCCINYHYFYECKSCKVDLVVYLNKGTVLINFAFEHDRMFDPRVNIMDVEWSPFKEVSFAMPLLLDLSPWRSKLQEMEKELIDTSNYTDVVFVADFPGNIFCNTCTYSVQEIIKCLLTYWIHTFKLYYYKAITSSLPFISIFRASSGSFYPRRSWEH